jgi:hypothetical protein
MTYSADSGYGTGPHEDHDHDGEFSIYCDACASEWVGEELMEIVSETVTWARAEELAWERWFAMKEELY